LNSVSKIFTARDILEKCIFLRFKIIKQDMMVMTKYSLSGIIFFLLTLSINAQEKTDNLWNIKLCYSRINKNYTLQYGNIGEITSEGNYRINRLFETGLYAGYSNTKSEQDFSDCGVTGTSRTSSHVLSYGVNSYFHLSSLFFKDNSRLGIRIIAKPGGFFIFAKEGYNPKGHCFTFRPGLGIDYRLFRKMAVFGEYVYGFGDGKYRAFEFENEGVAGYKNHIGSFRFGINIPF